MALNLKKRIIISLISILSAATAIFIGIFIINIHILEKNINDILKQNLVKRVKHKVKNAVLIEKQIINGLLQFHNEKKELKSEVDSLNEILSNVYTKFKNKKNIKEILADIVKYTQAECKCKYSFLIDTKGNLIAYPPYLQYSMPSNIFHINVPFQEKLKTILQQSKNKKEVFANYKWIDPFTSNVSEKLGFFKYIKPLDWILAESIYIAHVKEHLLNNIKTIINVKYGVVSKNGYFFLKKNGANKEGFFISALDDIVDITYTTKIEELNVTLGSRKNIIFINKFLTDTNKYISSQIYILLIQYLLFCLIVFGIIIYISNKTLDYLITKPIETIINQLKQIIKKENFCKEMQINTHDEFKILADEINNFLKYVRSRLDYYEEIVKKL